MMMDGIRPKRHSEHGVKAVIALEGGDGGACIAGFLEGVTDVFFGG